MFVSSMSSEELYAEAMKDFSILQTKIDLFMDRCGKRYRQEHFIGRFTKRMVVTTKRNNSWTIAFLALNEGVALLIYAPITGQETYGYDNAYYSTSQSKINDVEETEATKDLLDTYKEFTRLVEEADAITDDLDARYAAYAKAEAYMLQHAIVLPCYYQIGWCLSRVDNDTKMQPMFGSVGDKMKNWGSNADGYTSEEKGVAEQVKAYTEANA